MGTPAKFQTRQHTIEAVQFDGTKACAERLEIWSEGEIAAGGYFTPGVGFFVSVSTPDGVQVCDPDDWIVKDSGGFWVCPDDLFQRKYEPEAA
jgi:hypothetical protein